MDCIVLQVVGGQLYQQNGAGQADMGGHDTCDNEHDESDNDDDDYDADEQGESGLSQGDRVCSIAALRCISRCTRVHCA